MFPLPNKQLRHALRWPAPEAMSADLSGLIAQYAASEHDQPLGVAVSGGSDSLALLYLLADFAQQTGTTLCAVTVDHRLRPEAAEEAREVAKHCARLAVSHDTLQWENWTGQGNLQDAARRARYDLIAAWAHSKDIQRVALGHTQDDQAETLLMRLARGAGVDGLSAMGRERHDRDIVWLRPLLDVSRATLQDVLRRRGVSWVKDPSNDELQYDRVKARRALLALKPLGVTAEALAQVADNMQSAREALEHQTKDTAQRLVTTQCGAVCINWAGLSVGPHDIRRRLVLSCLRWVSRSEYPPRARALDGALSRVIGTASATLDGCLLEMKGNNLWISRELNAVQGQFVDFGALWDKRWRLTGPDTHPDCVIGPLGLKGLSECEGWRELGLPRKVLSVTPAVWKGENLVAAPLVNTDGPWQAVLERDKSSLLDAVFAH